jgi:hypothetical protein
MTYFSYIFPKIIDPDYGAMTSISLVEDSDTGTLPSFIIFKKTMIIINPILITDVGTYKMRVIITDTKETSSYLFKLTVTS